MARGLDGDEAGAVDPTQTITSGSSGGCRMGPVESDLSVARAGGGRVKAVVRQHNHRSWNYGAGVRSSRLDAIRPYRRAGHRRRLSDESGTARTASPPTPLFHDAASVRRRSGTRPAMGRSARPHSTSHGTLPSTSVRGHPATGRSVQLASSARHALDRPSDASVARAGFKPQSPQQLQRIVCRKALTCIGV